MHVAFFSPTWQSVEQPSAVLTYTATRVAGGSIVATMEPTSTALTEGTLSDG